MSMVFGVNDSKTSLNNTKYWTINIVVQSINRDWNQRDVYKNMSLSRPRSFAMPRKTRTVLPSHPAARSAHKRAPPLLRLSALQDTVAPLPGRVTRPVPLRPSIPRLPFEQPAHPSAHPHRPIRNIVLHRLACRHVGTLAHLHPGDHGATPHLRPRAHRGRHRLPRQPGAVKQLDPGSQLGPRAHAAVRADVAARAKAGGFADDGPIEDAAALAQDRARLDDGVGRQGAAVTDGCVGVDVGRGVYDGIVADGGSGLDDGGGDPGPEGWVVLVDDGCGGYAG